MDPNKILIIGSGITGLTTAIFIKKLNPEQEVLILERGQLPLGASTKNAGFACFGSVSELLDDLKRAHPEQVEALIKLRYQGLQKLLTLVDPEEIDYKQEGGYEIFLKGDERLFDKCLNKLDLCNEMAYQATGISDVYKVRHENYNMLRTTLPGIYNAHEAKLNPVLFMKALAKNAIGAGVDILYNTRITKVNAEEKKVETSLSVSIPYKKLALCTNGFTPEILPGLDVVPARNQVIITSPIENLDLPGCYHYNRGYVYFREYNGRVLIGGGRDKDLAGETTSEFGLTDMIRSYLEAFLNVNILFGKRYTIDHRWSGIMGVGASREPLIRDLGNNVFAGVRLGGMGIAIGSEIGNKLANMVV